MSKTLANAVAKTLAPIALAVVLATPVGTASAAEAVVLSAGDAKAANAVLIRGKAKALVLRTQQAGVKGALFRLSVDRDPAPVFTHVFSEDECRFADGGSRCEVTIPAGSAAYRGLIRGLRKGRTAHVTIVDGGAMMMDQTASLAGASARLAR